MADFRPSKQRVYHAHTIGLFDDMPYEKQRVWADMLLSWRYEVARRFTSPGNEKVRAEGTTYPVHIGDRDWDSEEDAYLLANYDRLPAKRIGVFLGRTESAVYSRAHKLKKSPP